MKIFLLQCLLCRMPRLLAVALVAFAVSTQPAMAQWPTTEWEVLDGLPDWLYGCWGGARCEEPSGVRKRFAAKHGRMLESASRWYESLGFSAPHIKTLDGDLTVEENEPYVGYLEPQKEGDNSSTTSTNGTIELNTSPGFLTVGTPVWALMEASAVHELFHAIQNANDSYREYTEAHEETIPTIPGCRGAPILDWIVEGMASAVQIRWLERSKGPWGHPFKGSDRAAWVRYFDQPLHLGSLPSALRDSDRKQKPGTTRVSWYCTYGTWYFWYAVGEMLGDNPREAVSYLRYIIERKGPWHNGGLALVDAGLREAAKRLQSIEPYSHGLYDLYPQFVAQYLDVDQFYQHLRVVGVGTPSLIAVRSKSGDGPRGMLQPLASRAWRFRVHVPWDVSSHSIPIRFTLGAQPGTDRRNLHLIVEQRVVGRPALEVTPYSHVVSIPPTPGTVYEYLVRVANVAPKAKKTRPAAFWLRVEVGGFFGQTPDSVDLDDVAAKVSAELPPGFYVRGPAPLSCSGGADARAVFSLRTPGERAQGIEAMVPEHINRLDDMQDMIAIAMDRAADYGVSLPIDPEASQAKVAAARARIKPHIREAKSRAIAAAAKAASTSNPTILAATFVGEHEGEECQVTLGAVLEGQNGGAQILHWAVDEDASPENQSSPGFQAAIYTPRILGLIRPLSMSQGMPTAMDIRSLRSRGEDRWEACTMTDRDRRQARKEAETSNCPIVSCTAGRLVLETVEQDHIVGTFQYEVIDWKWTRWPGGARKCRVAEKRGEVTGHFNVAAADEGYDSWSSLIEGMGTVPGAPILFDFSNPGPGPRDPG